MKKPKAVYERDGIVFDSLEELEFYHWVVEAWREGYIDKFMYHPDSIPLAPRVGVMKEITRELKKGPKTEVVEHWTAVKLSAS